LGLRLCAEGLLEARGADPWLTATTYNLCFWLGEHYSYVYLPSDEPSVAVVLRNGGYRLYSQSCSNVDELVKKLEEVMGLREDPSEFYSKARGDPLLGPFAVEYSGWRLRSSGLWWALVTGTCQQNASFKQGWEMLHRLVEAYGKYVEVEGRKVLRPPTPSEVLENVEKLLEAGVGYRSRTIINVARFLLESGVSERELSRIKPEKAEKVLRGIKGVGPYTARLAITFSTRRYELPPIDRWLMRIASTAYSIDEKLVEEYWVNKWGKWSALAAVAVTVALDAEPLSRALARLESGQLLPNRAASPTPVNMRGFCR
jgi:N-glycosylase/DNA lyase